MMLYVKEGIFSPEEVKEVIKGIEQLGSMLDIAPHEPEEKRDVKGEPEERVKEKVKEKRDVKDD